MISLHLYISIPIYLYVSKSIYLYNYQIFKDCAYTHIYIIPSSLSATACCHFLRGSCSFWWGDRIPWIFLGLWVWQFFTGFFASEDLYPRVQLKYFFLSLTGVLGAISDRACVAQNKTESGIFLSHSFSIMLTSNNNSSMSLHRLIFSWKSYCFKISFRSRERSSSANKKGAVILQRKQGSSPSHGRSHRQQQWNVLSQPSQAHFSPKCVSFAGLCCERCPKFCESIA